MITNLIIRHNKILLVNMDCLKNVFQFSKTKYMVNVLKQQLSKNRLSSKQNSTNLLQFLYEDTNKGNYQQYTNAKYLYEQYVKQIVNSKSFNEYDPYIIKEQGARLSSIMKAVSNYPKFDLQKQPLKQTYQIFCKFLNQRTDQQLSRALLFVLKVDKKAEQSVIFNEFLKFYLQQKWETLKAKYQLNLKSQSIGNFIKKMLGSITHRGFLRRSPNYSRKLQLLDPTQTLIYLIQNPSTKQSLLIRKIMYQRIFMQIVDYFEKTMHSNLYNQKNIQLWNILNKNVDIIFSGNRLVQKQCQYLRQLYVTLFLTLRQQNKDIVDHNVGEVSTGYGYIKQNYNSPKSNQFIKSVQNYLQQIQPSSPQNKYKFFIDKLKLSSHTFNIIKYFPKYTNQILNMIADRISPLTFSVYFHQLVQLFAHWNKQLIVKIINSEQNMFKYIRLQECLILVNKMKQQNQMNQWVGTHRIVLYNKIMESIINKQYKQQPKIGDIILMLQIYRYHRQLKQENSNLQTLRVFLFRFISDNKGQASKKQLEHIITIMLELDDDRLFKDQQGNYQLNIYQQLATVVDMKFVYTQLKDKLKEKANLKQQAFHDKARRLHSYLKNRPSD